MDVEPRPQFTESPWFWVLAFTLVALLALLVIGSKYGRRQSAMERKYQARQRIEEQRALGDNSANAARNDDFADRRPFASQDDTLVPLWPLAMMMLAIALFALMMLFRGRGRPGSHSDEMPSP